MEIRIRNLCKQFSSEGKIIRALDDITLTIPANQIFTLLGPSGCGKTTLLRCIVGLESPDSGEIAIGDEVVWSKERNIFVPTERRGLGMVFQTYAIWPHMNVFENVAYPLQTRQRTKADIGRMVAETLKFVQMEGFEHRPATQLSGGQQQRVALARALVAEPKVILFDEPLSNLDAKLREETRKELRQFLTRLEITAVYVTHDRIEALSLSDTVAVMQAGRIIEIGTPDKIYFKSDHRFVADFIGRANLLTGRVASTDGDTTIIDTAVGPVACSPASPIAPGSDVTVCIRPEFISVEPGRSDPGSNRFQGIVESLTFVGETYEGEIRVAGVPILTRVEPFSGVREGDEVTLSFSPHRCFLLSK
ncbi:MAG: ABC transporter ATP-binding protein [Desulfobacterales bacterium]